MKSVFEKDEILFDTLQGFHKEPIVRGILYTITPDLASAMLPAAILDAAKIGWNPDLDDHTRVRKLYRRTCALAALLHVQSCHDPNEPVSTVFRSLEKAQVSLDELTTPYHVLDLASRAIRYPSLSLVASVAVMYWVHQQKVDSDKWTITPYAYS